MIRRMRRDLDIVIKRGRKGGSLMPWIRDMQWIGFEEIMYKLFLLFANLIFYLFIFRSNISLP